MTNPSAPRSARRRLGATLFGAVLAATLAVTGLASDVAPAGALGAGEVAAFGDAAVHGSPGEGAGAIVGMARNRTGTGYWLAAADGSVYAHGGAQFHGAASGVTLNSPIVAMAATPTGAGYWLVAADGGVFDYGDAAFLGSAGHLDLNSPIVGMAATRSGKGYWLFAADGGIFTYGDAKFMGSMGGTRLNQPMVGGTATPSGGGYYLVARDGGVFTFGDARFQGSTGNIDLVAPIVDMAADPDGGYWLAAADGGVFAFAAPFKGSLGGTDHGGPIVAVEPSPSGEGYWLATGKARTADFAAATPHGTALGPFEVTCYSLRGTTASGHPVAEDGIAVDPRVIPLGSRVYIEGLGWKVARDTGSAVKGKRIDIWNPSTEWCRQFGVQTRDVWKQ